MYIIKTNKKKEGYNGGFFSENIDDLTRILSLDPTYVRQVKLSPVDQEYIARENIMAALAMRNPSLEVALMVMERFWIREAYMIIRHNMDDDESREIFKKEIHKLKLYRGGFADERDVDRCVWEKIKQIVLTRE